MRYEEDLVQDCFQHAAYTGLRDNHVHQQLKYLLKGGLVPNADLLQATADIIMMEKERLDKMKRLAAAVEVNKIRATQQQQQQQPQQQQQLQPIRQNQSQPAIPPRDQSRNSPLLAEMSKITAALSNLTNQNTALRCEVDELRSWCTNGTPRNQSVSGGAGGTGGGGSGVIGGGAIGGGNIGNGAIGGGAVSGDATGNTGNTGGGATNGLTTNGLATGSVGGSVGGGVSGGRGGGRGGGIGGGVGFGNRGGFGGARRRNPRPQCPTCRASNSYCPHCTGCGATDHIRCECPNM